MIIHEDTYAFIKNTILEDLELQLNLQGRLGFGKCHMTYNGAGYSVKTVGDDEKGAGGVWDLAGAFAVFCILLFTSPLIYRVTRKFIAPTVCPL